MRAPSLLDMEDVQFEIDKEVWNVYELDDGSVIRMRTVLVKLLMGPPTKVLGPVEGASRPMSARVQNIMTIIKCPRDLMGPPNPNPLQSPTEIAKMKNVEVGFTPFYEDFNVYRLPDGTRLKIKLVVSAVYRVLDQYDELGYPLYLVNSTNAIATVPKPKIA